MKKKHTVIEMEIPDLAKEVAIQTLPDFVRDLILTLPKGYGFKTKSGDLWNGFHSKTIHDKIIQLKGFENRNIRRTREALQYHYEKGLLGIVVDVNGNPVKKVVNGKHVKLYFRK